MRMAKKIYQLVKKSQPQIQTLGAFIREEPS